MNIKNIIIILVLSLVIILTVCFNVSGKKDKFENFIINKNIDEYNADILLKPSALSSYIKSYIDYSPSVNIRKPKGFKFTKIKITSSSYLKEKKIKHLPKHIHDYSLKTSWVEGVKGFGYKEWVRFYFKATLDNKKKLLSSGRDIEIAASHIIIYPGFGRSKKLFKENNRIKSLILTIHSKWDGDKNTIDEVYRLNFKDINKYHDFTLQSPETSGNNLTYTFYIENVYKGSKYNDTCISEIIFGHNIYKTQS